MRLSADPKIYVLLLTTQDRVENNRKIRVIVDPYIEWTIEFTNYYKVL